MSRLPSAAASRNISACSAQAMSQVGWRLMVASSANTSRPRAPAACGDIARALATKAAISSDPDGFASGKESGRDAPFWAEDTSLAGLGLVGSTDISARRLHKPYVGRDRGAVNAPERDKPHGIGRAE